MASNSLLWRMRGIPGLPAGWEDYHPIHPAWLIPSLGESQLPDLQRAKILVFTMDITRSLTLYLLWKPLL